MNILIKNGTLITASDTFEADILIEGETIAQIGRDLQHPNAEVIDAAGKLIMPGGIDPHVHLDLPMFDTVSSDDHYTGHKPAAVGGTECGQRVLGPHVDIGRFRTTAMSNRVRIRTSQIWVTHL